MIYFAARCLWWTRMTFCSGNCWRWARRSVNCGLNSSSSAMKRNWKGFRCGWTCHRLRVRRRWIRWSLATKRNPHSVRKAVCWRGRKCRIRLVRETGCIRRHPLPAGIPAAAHRRPGRSVRRPAKKNPPGGLPGRRIRVSTRESRFRTPNIRTGSIRPTRWPPLTVAKDPTTPEFRDLSLPTPKSSCSPQHPF